MESRSVRIRQAARKEWPCGRLVHLNLLKAQTGSAVDCA